MSIKIEKNVLKTSRLKMAYLSAGNVVNQPLILLHGNVSSNVFFEDIIKAFSADYFVIAPDMRGYGDTEEIAIDATRGLRDWSDDLKSLILALNIKRPFHLLGWSLGGGVVMQYAIDYPADLASMILISPVSPFGFGGTKDIMGTPCYENFAGSGGGTVNPVFLDNIKNGDRSDKDPNSPRNVMNQFYFKPPFRTSIEKEDQFVASMLATKVGDGFYPGTSEVCSEWPLVMPGTEGINNAMSPKYMNLSPLTQITPKPPILWVRGANDLIVSDQSFFDFGFLGKLGYVEGWPGEAVFPPQPMVSQTRYILEQYKEKGGDYEEVIIEDTAHSPHIEKHDEFCDTLLRFFSRL